jgi:predicted amidohydrolase
MLAVGSRDSDDIVIADLNLDVIREVRNTWQFFRDRGTKLMARSCKSEAYQQEALTP